MSGRFTGIVFGLIIGFTGCDNSGSSVATELEEPMVWITQGGEEAQVITPGLLISGDGEPAVTIVDTTPLVEFSGEYTWVLRVEDGAELGIDRITARPRMPDHGHGTLPAVVEATLQDNRATLEPLYLYMGGIWEIEVILYGGEEPISSLSVFVYVEG